MPTRTQAKPRRTGPILRGTSRLDTTEISRIDQARRQIMADLCRSIGLTLRGQTPIPPSGELPSLSPRMRQTLQRLLAGDSEKQIASHLGLSRHTVHVYVKAIYKGFGVASRGELLARFVRNPTLLPSIHTPPYTPPSPSHRTPTRKLLRLST